MWETGGEGGGWGARGGCVGGPWGRGATTSTGKTGTEIRPPPHSHPIPNQPPPPPPLLSLQGLYMGVGLGLGGLVGGYVHKELGARHVFAVAACVVAAAWGLCAAAEVALGVGREEGGGREGEEGEGEG